MRCRYSGGYGGRFLGIVAPLPPSLGVSTKPGQLQSCRITEAEPSEVATIAQGTNSSVGEAQRAADQVGKLVDDLQNLVRHFA